MLWISYSTDKSRIFQSMAFLRKGIQYTLTKSTVISYGMFQKPICGFFHKGFLKSWDEGEGERKSLLLLKPRVGPILQDHRMIQNQINHYPSTRKHSGNSNENPHLSMFLLNQKSSHAWCSHLLANHTKNPFLYSKGTQTLKPKLFLNPMSNHQSQPLEHQKHQNNMRQYSPGKPKMPVLRIKLSTILVKRLIKWHHMCHKQNLQIGYWSQKDDQQSYLGSRIQ